MMTSQNEPPKSIWTRPWKGRVPVLIWFALLAVAVFVVFVVLGLATHFGSNAAETVKGSLVVAVGLALVGMLALVFVRWIRLRRALFGLVLLATLIAVFYAEEDVRGKWEWERYRHKWEAKGQHFDIIHLAPPPVPEDQNFAMAPIVVSSYSTYLDRDGRVLRPQNTNVVDRMRMPLGIEGLRTGLRTPGAGDDWRAGQPIDLKAWQAYYQEAAKRTNQFAVPAAPQAPAADVLLALSKYDESIGDLRQAAQRPGSRYPLTYDSEEPGAILLPHLAPLKSCSQLLQLRASAELAAGESEHALADVSLALRLSQTIRDEPFLISQLVRLAMADMAIQPVWEGMVEHKWSDGELAELQRKLKTLDLLAGYECGMRGQMACDCGSIQYFRLHPKETQNPLYRLSLLMRVAPSGWYYQNELRCARLFIDWYLPLVDLKNRVVSPASARRADQAISADGEHAGPYNFVELKMVPLLDKAAERFAYEQNGVDLARVACALERYRLVHGRYPATLDELVPKFIEELPHDIINGKPLNYRRTANGQFVLYSVGWNEIDDGGKVVMTEDSHPWVDMDKGDWVWRFPAQ